LKAVPSTPGKPGRRSRETIALLAQLFVLAPQPGEFLALGRMQGGLGGRGFHLASALLPVSDSDPVPNGLGTGLELAGKIGRVASGTDQFDHPAPELRSAMRVRTMTGTSRPARVSETST
jgi:hypothetical protein